MTIPALDQKNLYEGVQAEEDPMSPEKVALYVREGGEQEPGWQRYSRYLGSERNVAQKEGLSVLPVLRTTCVQDLRTRFQRALKRAAFSASLNPDATFQLPDGGIVYRLSVSSDQPACIVWCDDASAEIRSKIERLFGPDASVMELGENVMLVEGGNVVASALPPSRMPTHRDPVIVEAGQPVFDHPKERFPSTAPCTSKKQTFGGHMAQQGWGFRGGGAQKKPEQPQRRSAKPSVSHMESAGHAIESQVLPQQTTFDFNAPENAAFPGGAGVMEQRFRAPLEAALARFEQRFMSLHRKLTVVWEGPKPTFTSAMIVSDFEDASYQRTTSGTKVTVEVYARDPQRLGIGGKPEDENEAISVATHELGHMAFGLSLPNDTCVQELASCYCEQQLSQNDPRQAGSFNCESNFFRPRILSGKNGWGLPPFALLKNIPSIPIYTAWRHGWQDLFGSDKAIEAALKRTNQLAESMPEIRLPDGKYRKRPSIMDWLEAMEEIAPGIQKRFQQSDTFGRMIPEERRVTWTPHNKWGGFLSFTTFKRNPDFCRFPDTALDLNVGQMIDLPGSLFITIHDLRLRFGTAHKGSAKLDPLSIDNAVVRQSGTHLPVGAKIEVCSADFLSEPLLELVWNETAQSMLK